MSFKAQLSLGGNTYNIINCSYTFHRDVDSKGRPSSGIFGGRIDLQIESTDDTSILEAMVNNQYKAQKGIISFYKNDMEVKTKELSFEDGYVVAFRESLDVIGSNPMTIQFTVSARKLQIGNAEHENDWPDRK